MQNVLTLLGILLSLAKTSAEVATLIQKARAEGRDVSDQELADLKAKRDAVFEQVFGK